jgi:type II restriction/modification system DNA methylase subunit YeeA
MAPTLSPQQFVNKWRASRQKERSVAVPHFLDLCALTDHPTPADADPTGTSFAFEVGANKTTGKNGFADVWKKGHFAWEYKGKDGDLDKAYLQLLQYREALQNPPLLIVCDIDEIRVHTNFTNTVKRIVTITLDDLLKPDGMRTLRAIFNEPDYFRSNQTTEQVTRTAAVKFAELADHLRKQGDDPEQIAHFLIRLLFCLFAEDIDLLPQRLFTRLVQQGRNRPERFGPMLARLFGAMATGGSFGVDEISYFNGGLFDDDSVLELGYTGLTILQEIAALDWGSIEPSILGTLFERSLDPNKRSQLGAHYTSRDDILLLVEPVLMVPLRREWAEVQEKAQKLADRRNSLAPGGQAYRTADTELRGALLGFAERIASTRVLDPACGSGNFLYVALRQMLDLEKEISQFAGTVGVPGLLPQSSPAQLYGIELNEYAHELAQATVWIGYIQWLHENGYGVPSEPILKQLDNIKQMDAILAFDAEGKPMEPEWPEAEVIVGNPPFLGDKKMRTELGNKYVEELRSLYEGRVPGGADLVTYWFERARALVSSNHASRVGLLSTNSIAGGINRRVLEGIKRSGNIFYAWNNRPWILDGAAVRVAMIGYDNGTELNRSLNGQVVESIGSDLRSDVDLTQAKRLRENLGIAYIGDSKKGEFDISQEFAMNLLSMPLNPNSRPNSDVVIPWANGLEVTTRPQDIWIVDFGVDMSEEDASLYEAPFAHILKTVKPARDEVRNNSERTKWWLHARPAPDLRKAIKSLSRYIATSNVSKHRLFVYLNSNTLPSHSLTVIARDDNFLFGILHSHFHEIWALRMGTSLEDRPRYTPTTTFETFPFPWPPGQEPTGDQRVLAIAQAAQELVAKRDAWLNPPGLAEADLKKRTLTNLYNQRPTWLDLAHKKLDAAVAAAYGWPSDLSDEEILMRLLALNLERAGD